MTEPARTSCKGRPRFAFAGRCSTEGLQDPDASRNWQLTRARALIEPTGGQIVAEYSDSGTPVHCRGNAAPGRSPTRRSGL